MDGIMVAMDNKLSVKHMYTFYPRKFSYSNQTSEFNASFFYKQC